MIEVPTLKEYLDQRTKQQKRDIVNAKKSKESLEKCAKAEALIAENKMTILDACKIAKVSPSTYIRYKKARR